MHLAIYIFCILALLRIFAFVDAKFVYFEKKKKKKTFSTSHTRFYKTFTSVYIFYTSFYLNKTFSPFLFIYYFTPVLSPTKLSKISDILYLFIFHLFLISSFFFFSFPSPSLFFGIFFFFFFLFSFSFFFFFFFYLSLIMASDFRFAISMVILGRFFHYMDDDFRALH